MRKMTMMCMAALLLMAVSCKKEKANEEYTGEGFRATTESHTGEGDSKTQLNSDLSVTWCDGDEIKVFSSTDSDGKKFSAASAGTEADFNPKEDVTDAFFTPPYTAFYPESAVRGTNQIHLDGTQHYTTFDDGNGNNVLTFASGENPMAAQSSNKVLPFKNLCGILKFQLYSATSCTVKSLSVTSLKSGEQLWGTGTVTFDGQEATLGALSNGGASVVLDCGEEGVALGTSEGTSTEFLVVIPDGALSEGFTVTVTDADDKVWSKTTTANNTITKSKIKAMPKQAVTTTKPIEFTVDADGTKVKFAPGNLQYLGSSDGTGTWRFAEHQWDYMGEGPASGTTKQGNVDLSSLGYTAGMYNTGSGSAGGSETAEDKAAARDLFGWGCTGFQDMRKDDHSNWYQTNYMPYSTSTSTVNTTYNYYGYGPDFVSSPYYNLTVEKKSDWGCVTGLPSAGGGKSWRTLSTGEWSYLLNTSGGSSGRTDVNRFAKAMVNGVVGLLIFPDGYNGTAISGITGIATVNSTSASYPSVSIPTGTWASMESAGVVFLPAAGDRNGTSVINVGSYGYYWSSSYNGSSDACYLSFYSGNVSPSYSHYRYLGFSVRLVSEN